MNSPVNTFLLEAEDLVQNLEAALLELDETPNAVEPIDTAFRALHTLKGSGNMFGFTALGSFIHHFEEVFELIRKGSVQVTPDLVELALDSRDHIGALIALGPNADLSEDLASTDAALLDRLHKIVELPGAGKAVAPAKASVAESGDGSLRLWEIHFKAEPNALGIGFRPDLLFEDLSNLGRLTVEVQTTAVPDIEKLESGECYLTWKLTLESSASKSDIEDIFIFQMDAEISIEEKPHPSALAAQKTDAAKGDVAEKGAKSNAPASNSGSVRVQASRLDDLMDQLGELVIVQARLKSIVEKSDVPGLAGTVEEIEALITGLRDTTLSIRMLPISMVFGSFKRLVRDLSADLQKTVTLITEGGETEVDKNIIDALSEPLVHMIRNSLDHGIETPAVRATSGKPQAATLCLRAEQSGGEVLISVLDDGAGLNTEAIRNRAVERGMISKDQVLTEKDLHQLIFEPGFSTAQTVSNVSGRGVGMDAARRVIDSLRGTIDVRSQVGKGTKVTIRLPLTLAIIEGLLVQVDDETFVIPLASVEECVDLPDAETLRDNGRSMLQIRDQWVPYLNLDTLFGFASNRASGRRVIIVSVDGRRIGLVVDDVLGRLQTVIKPLSPLHRGVEGLAGATILGDGSVALILDANALVRRAGALHLNAA